MYKLILMEQALVTAWAIHTLAQNIFDKMIVPKWYATSVSDLGMV